MLPRRVSLEKDLPPILELQRRDGACTAHAAVTLLEYWLDCRIRLSAAFLFTAMRIKLDEWLDRNLAAVMQGGSGEADFESVFRENLAALRCTAADAEGRIRSLFGVGERAFTTKEKKFISAWINDMGYSIEIIEKAYEVTADATGKGSIPYANSVLERWFAAGLRTLEEIEDSYRSGDGDKPHEGSFDTDSFFEAAVRRSLSGE